MPVRATHKDGIQHPAVTTRRAAAEGAGLDHERLEEGLFLVRQQTSQHRRIPSGDSLNHLRVKNLCPRRLVPDRSSNQRLPPPTFNCFA